MTGSRRLRGIEDGSRDGVAKRERAIAFVCATAIGMVSLPAVARATPADVFFVLDTSASMEDPAPGDASRSKLDVARELVARLATAAEAAGHRVGLLRFRQRTVTVMSGEGPREMAAQDPEQCRRGADVLVPLEGGVASRVRAWVDGEQGQGLDEVVTLGDSPLYASARVVLRYVDGLRAVAPDRHCVRAVAVFVTDGVDTCAGGAELLETLAELDATASDDGIQTLVVAFDREAEAAARIARIGREEGDPRVFAMDEGDDVEERIEALDGATIIASCGQPPGTEPDPPDAGMDGGEPPAPPCDDVRTSDADDGCAVASERGVRASWLVVWGALVLVGLGRSTRRWLARVGLLLIALGVLACGDDDATTPPRCPPADLGSDAPGAEDAGAMPIDPDIAAARQRARQAAVREALEAARDSARALVEPSAVFDAIEGDARDGCRALLDAVAFSPYVGAQRGVRGCLATRACNALDQTLLLQACLAHHGIDTEIHACRAGALDAAITELEHEEAAYPDVEPIDTALGEAALATLDDQPAFRDDMVVAARRLRDFTASEVVDRAAESAEQLADLTSVDAAASRTAAEADLEAARDRHYFLTDAEGARLDALLAAPTDCLESSFQRDREHVSMHVELEVQNVNLSGTSFSYRPGVVIGSFDVDVADRWGEPIEIVIAGAEVTRPQDGVPAPAEAGCFRAFLDGTRTAAFPLVAGDVEGCGGDVAPGLEMGHGFGRLILRAEIEEPAGVGVPRAVERILVDRWAYATDVAMALANGPAFGTSAARRLVPMRVTLQAGAGMPGPHEELFRVIDDRLGRYDEIAARALATAGVVTEPVTSSRTPDVLFTALGLVRQSLEASLADGTTVRSHAPWLAATVERRVLVPGEGFVAKRIFDWLDVPVAVHASDPAVRLRGAITVGALFTEAERLASMAIERELRILNAGPLLRARASDFAAYGSDAAHAETVFPLGMREIADLRVRQGDELLVTPGLVEQHDTSIASWWRIDPLGVAIGDIRYEGTLYGGSAPAKAIAGFTRCLGFQAIVALTGPRVAVDVECCRLAAFQGLLEDLITDWIMSTLTGGIGLAIGATEGDLMQDVVESVADGVSLGMGIADDIMGLMEPPECLATFEND